MAEWWWGAWRKRKEQSTKPRAPRRHAASKNNDIQNTKLYTDSVCILYECICTAYINNMLSITTRSQPTMSIINNFIFSLSLRMHTRIEFILVSPRWFIFMMIYAWTTNEQHNNKNNTELKKRNPKTKINILL